MNMRSQVKKPDFAFPQTVAKEAKTDIDGAVASNNPKQAMNGLLRLWASQTLIDRAKRPEVIARTQEVADKFAKSDMAGLYDALLAKMYLEYYESDQWKFNRRETPLLPYPSDLSEWSGAQFKARIKALLGSAMSHEAQLKALKLGSYADVVEANRLTTTYYPTLLDFVYQSACRAYEEIGCATDSIEAAALAAATTDAARIQWLSQSADTAKLKSAYLANTGSEYDALLLQRYIYRTKYIATQADKKWMVEQLRWFCQKHPANPLKANLDYEMKSLLTPRVNASSANLTSPGAPLEVKVESKNAPKVVLEVYKTGTPSRYSNSVAAKSLKGKTPIKTIEIDFDGQLPFEADTVAKITIDAPGYYAIVPKTEGVKNLDYFNLIRCIPVYPILANQNNDAYAVVVNPANGSPIEGAKVIFNSDKYKSQSTVTNGIGLAHMPVTKGLWSVAVTHNGQTTNFPDVSMWLEKGTEDETAVVDADVLTDRAIYHPGDKVNALCICTESLPGRRNTQRTKAGAKVEARLLNANRESIDTVSGTSDNFGRFAFDFTLPSTGLTGNFTIVVEADGERVGSASFMVSDYRMPDFEIKDVNVARDLPAKGGATIEGAAMSYSGMPLAGTTVTAQISRVVWWRWFTPQGSFYSTEVKTDSAGRFRIELAPGVFKDQGDNGFYMAQLSASSLSGTTATASTTFSLGKPYIITLNSLGTIDGEKPFAPMAEAIGPDGKKADLQLKWTLLDDDNKPAASGMIGTAADINGIRPATYTLNVEPMDTTLADAATAGVTIYNRSTDVVPDGDLLWILNSEITYGADRKAKIELGTALDSAYIYYVLTGKEKIDSICLKPMQKGYGEIEVEIPAGVENASLTFMLVNDCSMSRRVLNIKPAPRKDLQVVCQTFRDNLLPGGAETWQFSLRLPNGAPAYAALALDMYNKALDALTPHRFYLQNLSGYSRWAYVVLAAPDSRSNSNSCSKDNRRPNNLVSLNIPVFRYFNPYDYIVEEFDGVDDWVRQDNRMMPDHSARSMKYMASAEVMEDAAVEAAPVVAGAVMADDAEEEAANDFADVDLRDAEVPLAIWAPMLTTDIDGNVCYSFTVPNANATWKLNAVAWTKDWLTGALQHDFVASKPIMVMPNAPRFLREGDQGCVQAMVANKTDVAVLADIAIEFFNPIDGAVIGRKDFSRVIEAMSTAEVSAMVDALPGVSAIGYRVVAKANGNSDGEQGAMPVLPALASLIETQPFYLNPGETEFSTLLPSDPGARISLTFSENPVWSVVSALPGLRKEITYANSAAAAIFSAALARGIVKDNPMVGEAIEHWLENPQDSTLVSMLEKNADLKAAVLNSTPWVQAAQSDNERMANLAMIFSRKETDAAIKKGVDVLRKLQKSDGGWAWGDWMNESSVWVTENVLTMMAELKRYGWLPADKQLASMIGKAVRFLDGKLDPKQTDELYAILRPAFADIPVGANGQRVIVNTVNDILKNWKSYSSPAYKAVAAVALYLNNYPAKAHELMASVSEFGVTTPSQGLRFPSVDALSSYASILMAYALVEPGCKEIDGLRQQLIVRKQGADWGSAVVTSEVVAAIVSSGTRWTVEARGAEVTAGGHAIEPQGEIEKYTGSMRADLSAYAGRELTVRTSGTGPAYGAVFSQFKQAMADVKASSCDDLSIEKSLLVRRGTEWEAAGAELKVGDVVKVQLTIHCKRNLSYVAIIDERAAAFQPVDQLPGWMWSEGVGFYRENRDAATNLYVSYMGPGTYLLTYELNVTNGGTYSSGVASIQSQYAPEISAHSAGSALTVK